MNNDTSTYTAELQPQPVEPSSVLNSPRVRWAAIIWGALFATVAVSGIWMLSSTAGRDGVADWAGALTPNAILTTVLLAVGVVVLVAGAVGLIRRVQRRRTAAQ